MKCFRKGVCVRPPGRRGILFDDIGLHHSQDLLQIITVGMDIKIDRFGQVEREDTHDGLGVDNVTAGDQIEILIKTIDINDKMLNLVDRIQ